ncbi:DUF4350 domain-containing protein [Thermococcus sp.]|uniref:DUF4350 domain-containing protein n=1 Tax=Thermococcus sp. TaxID=35749 RepID=UPI0025E9A473|nr:DUF4350 domain-containing protein [Thermococcus sp.]
MKRLAIAIVLLLLMVFAPVGGIKLALATTSEPAGQYVVKIINVTASADAYSYIYKGQYYKWYSYHEYSGKYELAIGNSSYYQRERTYLRFNLSEIPKVAEIANAEVCVYVAYIKYFSTPMNVGIYNITNDWKESYTNPAPTPEVLFDNKTLSKGWVCFNVTSYIKAKFPEQSVFSFVLKLVNESIYNYAWIYSRENAFDKPVLKISYYVPVAVSSLVVNEPVYSGIPSKIYASITNGGNVETNVTFYLKINGVPLYIENITLQPKSTETIVKTWIPTMEGQYNITAEIVGNGVSDLITKSVQVYVNPYRLFYGLTYLYENGYEKIAPQLDEFYANFTATVQELEKCGVNLGDLADDVKWIETNYNLTKAEYAKFLEMKNRTALFLSGNRLYTYSVMVHIRKARFLAQDVVERIEKVLPVLQETLVKVEPLCHPQVNETNQTQTNQTTGNITAPSNGTTVNQTANYTIHITKVLIDLSHGQYYFTRYGFTGLQKDIEELGWEVNVTYAPLTYDELKEYDVVILTNPKTKLSDDEISALRKYVKDGGALFVAGDWYKYLSEDLNVLLEGTGVRFEKTELMDDDRNSGKPYYPFVGVYNRNCSITKFIPENWTMYYNGDTIKVTGNAIWIIRGYESAYAVDADGNIVYEKGSEPVVAAAVTFGKGRIVVYGSSKALSDAYYGKYIKSNWPFVKGALLWLVGEN